MNKNYYQFSLNNVEKIKNMDQVKTLEWPVTDVS